MAAEVGKRKPTGAKDGHNNASIKTVTEQDIIQLSGAQTPQQRARPNLMTQQSNSLPSTPHIGGQDMNGHFRTPSPVNRPPPTSSSRTARSESDTTLRPPGKTLLAGCQYETGFMNFKRRMPYSLGSDKLESSPTKVKKHLDPDEEKKLSGDMRELYDRLQPTKESEEKRVKFVKKLETLLNERWPGNKIKVHVFGSSGNSLFTNDSDVDICITTKMDALQRTCLLAKALGEYGMKNIECRPNAKVPIVKMWDPELKLACDMNVNNTAALHNTKMMKAYVHMDPRVRPLAMIIKYWTRRRFLNDAALGGTLSSYTWLCMIINFLQCRNPKILPSLQQPPYLKSTPEGLQDFAESPEAVKDFSKTNRESLGDLLFAFFRRYAHEVDYERVVISVREGALILKQDKRWHPGQNTRLCVEEPFNIDRNLGNTADDTSFRGVHLELRRAFDLISQGRLDECFEEYEFPPQEERISRSQHLFTKPVPQPRPVLTRSQSQTGSNRTPRVPTDHKKTAHQGQKQKVGNSNRRASSAMPPHKMPTYPMPFVDMTASGSQLHETLAHQYQKLQRQEQQLRAKMQHQGELSSGVYGLSPNGNAYFIDPMAHNNGDTVRRHSNASRSPRQVPLQHFTPLANMPGIANFLPPGFLSNQIVAPQTMTNPPSPSLTHAQLGFRGSARRAATIDPSQYTSIRSHSQPPANNLGITQQGVYMQPDAYIPAEWQGLLLGQRSLQEIQNDYLQYHQRRYPNDDGGYDVRSADAQQFNSAPPSEVDFSPTHAKTSQDDSVTDISYSRGGRSATLPHIVTAVYEHEDAQVQREMNGIATTAPIRTDMRTRPRASSSVAAHGISFFADEAIDSPERQFVLPVRKADWHNGHASFSRRIRGDVDPPFAVNGLGATEHEAALEQFVELAPTVSSYSSDAIMTPTSSAATPTQEASENLSLDGNLDQVLIPKPLPVPIQFGQFPARAPYRTGQNPKPDDIRGGTSQDTGKGLYSHTLSGLGINITSAQQDSGLGNGSGSTTQSPTVAGLNLASTLKPGSILSPVREVRTPSPTATRGNGFLMQSHNKTATGPSRVIGITGPEMVSSPLATGPTSYSKAHNRARSVETVRRQPNKQSQSASPISVKGNGLQKPQGPTKATQKSEAMETSGKSIQQQHASTASSSQNVPQTLSQQGGWQQSATGKKKKNKKAASVGSITLPIDISERKGG